MSMGYDEDDPRGAAMRESLRAGQWKLQPGQKANVYASKLRAGAMPSSFIKGVGK